MFERSQFTPDAPCDTGEFIGQGDGGDVVAPPLFDLQGPGAEIIGPAGSLSSPERRPSAVNEEHADGTVAPFGADSP